MRLPRKENTWSLHHRLFEENVRKNQEVGLQILRVKGSGVVSLIFVKDKETLTRIIRTRTISMYPVPPCSNL